MKILKVIVDEVPEGCGDCRFVNIHTPGKGTDWEECEIYHCELTGEEVINDARPDYGCPLVDNFMTLDEFQAALDEC